MRIFLRTFNRNINSKTGALLSDGQYRGTPEWIQFQSMLIECLHELGHETFEQLEMPFHGEPDGSFDKRIYVHQTKRERPYADFFWMQMHLRELFTLDTNGWGADHSDNIFRPDYIDMKESRDFCRAKSLELLSSGISKIDQPQYTSETPPRFILVPVQIPRDYTILHHSPITVKYFLESIQAWAIENDEHICFKMHPNNAHDYDLHKVVDDAAQSSSFIHKAEGNIHELIKRSSGLFVINSGVGFESLIHGKPIATFGACDYSRVTFNADLRRLDEARNFIFSYKGEWKDIGYKFVWWYWMKHAYDVNREDTKPRLMQYLKEHL